MTGDRRRQRLDDRETLWSLTVIGFRSTVVEISRPRPGVHTSDEGQGEG